ncbi:hypothetical protein [Bosea sp. BIWAKO-01]|uniref:hypothetical protein n=1 Tax=Bosea sp. BIWAKO-01 TaxID=506668 RepID=UPI000868D432|nr:hypothetical protein [Bosea sp. BIWAKO-01]GAU83026.1 hypothetical protein BIWAKO_02949 [Bosea sp. BIWAKO-01]
MKSKGSLSEFRARGDRADEALEESAMTRPGWLELPALLAEISGVIAIAAGQ